MTTPALVASDLDGTLLRTDLSVSDRTLSALDRLVDADIPFVMVTGRPVRWLSEVFHYTGHHGVVVCANGAVVYDPAEERVLARRPLQPELLAEVVERLRDEFAGVTFAVELADGMRHEHTYPVFRMTHDVRPGELAELLAEPALKLLARVDGRVPHDLTAEIARSLHGMVEVTRSSDASLVEISAAGVTKATGLAWVAEQHDVHPDDIAAFGDMPNDLPMFAYVGHSVAMANAEPPVREAADAVTGSNDNDGVATYLDRLLDGAPAV